LLYLRARHYSPADGRFTSRDTWMGDYSSPQSLNRWNYSLSNPAMYVDPSGNIPIPPYPQPPLLDPGAANKIQQNLYLLGDPSKATGWEKFIEKYRTKWEESHQTIWWLNLLCQDKPLYDMKEIIMAIDMAKEFSGVHYDEARQVWSEAVGRRYWQNCTNFACFVLPDWTASNAFLNFLSYDESIRKMTMTDVSLIFMTQGIRNSTLDVAKNITRNGLGAGGKIDNRPYDYFCTNCSGITSPTWLTDWLTQVVKNRPKSFGMKSHSGDGEMQVAFATGGSGIFTVILTPRQRMDLCGQFTCFDPALKKPEWMK
jgi:hypothetical protein